ncbi:MAG: Rieske 2Fe-2S domain-containing protein [Nitrososphaerota archaeon]|nr:Rieske 2Fe-2S domain-containing protein [Nitrososphaerota archaeon]
MTSEGKKDKETGRNVADEAEESRRNLLKVGLAVGAVLVVGGIGSVARTLIEPGVAETTSATQTTSTSTTSGGTLPPPATPGFPVIKIANVADLGSPITFNYPLEETPNLLVKLGQKAEGGVGPDSDIVAFSQICQHLGCIWGFVGTGSSPSCDSSYKAPGPEGYCCCHGSAYDLVDGAKVVGGPAPRPQPQVILYFDSSTGDIYATGMTAPTIFGHSTGSNDVSADLKGGTLVS